jgi:XTP/dITP diphosphohydrolase
MEKIKIIFVSKNPHKVAEINELLKDTPIQAEQLDINIEELQTEDDKKLVSDKLLQAFKKCGRPVFVEHTSLHINYLNGFPGGLTQIFWDKLQADKFVEMVGNFKDKSLTAQTIIGYCDGKKMYFFDGQISGTVPLEPAGPREFQWDCVFVPDGYVETFAKLGMDIKNQISMRKIAYDKFINFLNDEPRSNRFL